MTENDREPSAWRRRWADLGPRFMSALVLVPLAVIALLLGGMWFALIVGVVFAGAYREWEIMATGRHPELFGFLLIGLVALTAFVFPFFGISASLAIAGAGALAALLLPGGPRGWRMAGVAYFSLVVTAILSIRGAAAPGIAAGVFLGVSVWLTDSAAFFAGRQVGGAKLSPDISPSKTWSGAIGGLAIGTIGGTIVWLLTTPSPWWIGTVLAFLLSITGQAGDLGESAIKRHFRIKDSSDLIPGHGGLMDRLDSLTLAALLVLAIGYLHGGGTIAEGLFVW